MTRFAALLTLAVVAAPASAGTYAAKPAVAPGEARIIARDIAWNFAGGIFTGRTDESRPMVLCQGLAKRAGRLDSFTADGRAFTAADLAKCNASAKGGETALAAN